MEARLANPEQLYIALSDRPTIADISYFPFAMPWMFNFLGVDVNNWPNVQEWGERMLQRPAVRKILEVAPSFGREND
jgi:glutathione S-transferase